MSQPKDGLVTLADFLGPGSPFQLRNIYVHTMETSSSNGAQTGEAL